MTHFFPMAAKPFSILCVLALGACAPDYYFNVADGKHHRDLRDANTRECLIWDDWTPFGGSCEIYDAKLGRWLNVNKAEPASRFRLPIAPPEPYPPALTCSIPPNGPAECRNLGD